MTGIQKTMTGLVVMWWRLAAALLLSSLPTVVCWWHCGICSLGSRHHPCCWRWCCCCCCWWRRDLVIVSNVLLLVIAAGSEHSSCHHCIVIVLSIIIIIVVPVSDQNPHSQKLKGLQVLLINVVRVVVGNTVDNNSDKVDSNVAQQVGAGGGFHLLGGSGTWNPWPWGRRRCRQGQNIQGTAFCISTAILTAIHRWCQKRAGHRGIQDYRMQSNHPFLWQQLVQFNLQNSTYYLAFSFFLFVNGGDQSLLGEAGRKDAMVVDSNHLIL